MPATFRAKAIIIAAALAALTAAIVLVLTTSGANTPSTTQAASQQCPSATQNDTIPSAPPADLRWKSVGPWLVPTSASAGPASTVGPLWECYAHTPTGAVIAAYDIFAGMASPDWHTVAEHETVPGAGQQAFITAGEQQSYQAPAPGEIPPAVGFQVVSYTPQQATIETLADAGETYQANLFTVAWYDGDWKFVLTRDGRSGPDPQLITSASGFVMWGSAGNG